MHFEFSGKKIKLLATAVMVFMLIFIGVNNQLFLDPEKGPVKGTLVFALAMLSSVAAFFLICLRSSVDEKYQKFVNTLVFFIMPIFSMQMVEVFQGKFVYDFATVTFILNYLVYVTFYLFFYAITGKYHMVGLIVNISLYVWSLLNYFIEFFRGSPFVPFDILSFGTGLGVADGYKPELSWYLIMGSIMMFLIYLVNKRIKNIKPEKKKGRAAARLGAVAFLAVFLSIFFLSDAMVSAGYKPDFWNQSRGYHKTGSFFNFCLNTRYLRVKKPSGYNAKTVASELDEYLVSQGCDPEGEASINMLTGKNDYVPNENQIPNVICIMNESLADLREVGDVQTNLPLMSFIDSLEENTIKGNLLVPVFGAGTSNTEYEFLSGNTVSLLPAGSNVYELYIKDEIPSLTSSLSTLGYSKLAYHPYYGAGWNRELVYNLMGFEDFISIEDFIDESILETYKKNNDSSEYQKLLQQFYPGESILLRRFVSDAYDYQMVEQMYEERDTSKPFYMFNVTMQNHGGYAMRYSNFLENVKFTNLVGNYPKANRYASLVRQSDRAFEQLVNYFEQVDEPTIICMFGDHQPSIENEFYEEVMGASLENLTTEQEEKRYTTPFVIWANFDIEEGYVERMSANYLSTLLMEAAGLPLTKYNRYLAALYQELPVINTVGHIDHEGQYYSIDEQSSHQESLNLYNRIEYNNLIDRKHRDNRVFFLDEE